MDKAGVVTTYNVKPSGCSVVGGYVFIAFLIVSGVAGLYACQHTANVYDATFRNLPAATATPDSATIKATSFPVSYDNLARYTEHYTGKTVHFQGEVIQVDERAGDTYLLRVKVDDGDAVIVHYEGPRVLPNDKVDLYGLVDGRITYETVLGASLTVPELTARLLTVQLK